MNSARRKILVSAYACEPGKGSEPGVGWNWVQQIAQFHDVWVITRANNRRVIDSALQERPLPNVRWSYFDLPSWLRVWKKGQRGARLYYYLWQIGACLKARKLHESEGFDLTHHVTFGNYWLPSFLPFVGVPFVWGPLGGAESAPQAFYRSLGLRGVGYEELRSCARWLGEKNPVVGFSARNAGVVLAKANETAARLRALGASRVELCSEAGIANDEFARLSALPLRRNQPFRLVSIGRLLAWKGFHLGLKAFAQLQRKFPESEYYLIGNGPERHRLEKLARGLGVARQVRFYGILPRDEVLQRLTECDVLIHPSLHDSGGWVCLEAMAAGRPVVCLKLGGPALQVTDETGFPVPAMTPQQVIEEMAAAMIRLAQDLSLRHEMGHAARQRVREKFLWQSKALVVEQLYSEILARASGLAWVSYPQSNPLPTREREG